jgi:hypothetical protein
MRRLLPALVVLSALALPAAARGAARFAVVAGNDVGAAARPKLWFAQKDSEGFARTLVELGDFAPDRVTVLRGAGATALREAMAAAEAKIRLARAAGERTLLVFYYSGHAAAGGLELGGEKVPFSELRAIVSGSSADARVAIVDACEAGLLTQVKGAVAAPALDFALPSDEAVQGTAFVASTAVGEQAQESAALGGSFFTRHLEAALRGAGDGDADGLVTLAEAFRYTSSMTVAGTAATQVGAQHPTYEFRMSGRGDIVLADLRRAEARLRIPPDPGAVYVLRGARGSVLAELPGAPAPVALALPAGRYAVERRSDRGRATGGFSLARGDDVALPLLSPTRYELARSKGGPKPGLLYTGVGATWVDLPGFAAATTLRLGVRKEVGPLGFRVRVDYAFDRVTDQELVYDYSLLGGAVAALYPVNAGRILLEAGPELGYAYATQSRVTWQGVAQSGGSSGVGQGGLALLLTAPLGSVRVGLDASFGAQVFQLGGDWTVRAAASAAVLVLYGF